MATSDALASTTPTTANVASAEAGLSALTLLRYLRGSRDAILRVAESRAALWIGLLFVLAAGFAREYDGADLLHEPWHLVLPLAASLGTSLVLYTLVFIAAGNRGLKDLRFLEGYRTLLTFYWWTAPLAWLYAIPVERFMSPGIATAANLWLLAIVSVWRVLLITRALSVWLGASFIGMFFIVMFFADTVAVLLAFVSPKPIFDIMGGVRLSEPDRVVLDTLLTVMFFGSLSWFIWLIAAAVVIGKKSPPWRVATTSAIARRASKSLWAIAVLFLMVGIAILPVGQPEQQRRRKMEELLHAGALDAAARYASQLTRGDFPPVWDPPPRLGYREKTPQITNVIAAIEREQAPTWLRDMYVGKLTQDPHREFWNAVPTGDNADPAEFNALLDVFEKYVPVESLDNYQRADLQRIAEDDRFDSIPRTRLSKYLKLHDASSKNSAPIDR